MADIPHMIQLAVSHLKNAHAPYSKFHVSCCIQGINQRYYVGVNVENIVYPLGNCAEASAISQMVTDGCKGIDSVVLLTSENRLCSPCGGCRQRLYEFATPSTKIYLCNQKSVLKEYNLTDLLPEAFHLLPT
jgi:cytidine deaminase